MTYRLSDCSALRAPTSVPRTGRCKAIRYPMGQRILCPQQHMISITQLLWVIYKSILKKNVPWHILAPRAVACDSLHLRASAHLWHVSAFLCNREFLGISCYIKIPGYTRRGPCSKYPLFMLFPEKFRKFTDSPFSPTPSPDASPVQPSSQLRRRPGPGSPRRLFLPDLPRGRRRRAFRSHPR